MDFSPPYIAFAGPRKIAQGSLLEVASQAQAELGRDPNAGILVFDAFAQHVELDLRGSSADLQKRLTTPQTQSENAANGLGSRTPGRPKLGVVAREVTLLPRHWEWLGAQPGGASVALRKLVENARKGNEAHDRQAREICYRFLHAIAGNQAGFEEAVRALFAGNQGAFAQTMAGWPEDVRAHALDLAASAHRAS